MIIKQNRKQIPIKLIFAVYFTLFLYMFIVIQFILCQHVQPMGTLRFIE